jgi:hypothetical protein
VRHADAKQKADVLGFVRDNGISGALHIFVPNGDARTQKAVPLTPEGRPPLDDVKRHLVENEAQRTEVTGYINQLSIQLHRWQLRLQKLNERRTQLEAELSGHAR